MRNVIYLRRFRHGRHEIRSAVGRILGQSEFRTRNSGCTGNRGIGKGHSFCRELDTLGPTRSRETPFIILHTNRRVGGWIILRRVATAHRPFRSRILCWGRWPTRPEPCYSLKASQCQKGISSSEISGPSASPISFIKSPIASSTLSACRRACSKSLGSTLSV